MSLWADEIFTVSDSRQDVSQIMAGTELDHPLGYFLLEHFALEIWGKSEYALRLLSAFAGTVTIALIYVIGSQIANRRVGLWAVALLAVAPFHIRYSQEARGYALQVALLAASTGLFAPSAEAAAVSLVGGLWHRNGAKRLHPVQAHLRYWPVN